MPKRFALLALCFLPTAASGQASSDGRIVEQVRCAAHDVPYEQFLTRRTADLQAMLATNDSVFRSKVRPTRSDTTEYEGLRRELLARRPMPRPMYDSTLRSGRYECVRIRYLSDGLRVVGFIFRPTPQPGRRYPVIIYNRGGNRDFGKMIDLHMSWFLRHLNEGYVVIAPQYRGTDGGDGREEFGGADVQDVMSVIPLIHSLPYADTANVFMVGASRGGMMTYLALARGIRVNAAAVESGPVDIAGLQKKRPDFEQMWATMIPDFDRHRDEFYRSRSAILWADRIRTPVLIFQGTADWRVEPRDALRMADKLQELGRTYALVMYAGDDHALSKNREDCERRTLEWFRTYTVRR